MASKLRSTPELDGKWLHEAELLSHLFHPHDVLHQLEQAVAYLHKAGIVNRDLKPQNTLIMQAGAIYSPSRAKFLSRLLTWASAVV